MTLKIAVSGHRPNRLTGTAERIGAACRTVLATLKNTGRWDGSGVAISALAEGSDRIFAKAALDEGYALHVLIPFAEDDYIRTFEKPHHEAYDILVRKAARTEMIDGDPQNAPDAYLELGREFVRRADVLVSIWDGKPAAGKGGTTDVIDMMRVAGKPVIWVKADGSQLLHLITRDHNTEIEADEIGRLITP